MEKTKNKDNKDAELLRMAAILGDVEGICDALDSGCDVNANLDNTNQAVRGSSALLIACEKNQFRAVKLLLERGAAVNLADENSRTPLMIACQDSGAKICSLLIERGAYLDATDQDQWRPITYASVSGSLDVVNLLIGLDVEVDAPDANDLSPLLHACLQHHRSKGTQTREQDFDGVKKALVNAGANISRLKNTFKADFLTLTKLNIRREKKTLNEQSKFLKRNDSNVPGL